MRASRHILGALALLLASACGGETASAVDDTTTGMGETGVPTQDCVLGHERCGCMAGACLEGLVCLSDLCVMPAPSGESSGSAEASDDGPATLEGSGPTSDGETTAETTTDATTTDDASSSGAPAESSTTELAPVCLEGDNYCDDGDAQTCVDGQWQYADCDDVCGEIGYLSPGCLTDDVCECTGYADPTCEAGGINICICVEVLYDQPCTDAVVQQWYDACYQEMDPIALCFADFVIDSVAACNAAVDACA